MLETLVSKEGNVNIIYLKGDLDATVADQLSRLLVGMAAEGRCLVVLDLKSLRYISSNGLEPLSEWLRATQDSGAARKLALCNLNPFVASVFEVTQFNRKFPVFDTLETALASF